MSNVEWLGEDVGVGQIPPTLCPNTGTAPTAYSTCRNLALQAAQQSCVNYPDPNKPDCVKANFDYYFNSLDCFKHCLTPQPFVRAGAKPAPAVTAVPRNIAVIRVPPIRR